MVSCSNMTRHDTSTSKQSIWLSSPRSW